MNELLFKIDIVGNEKTLQELAKIKGELLILGKSQSDLNTQFKKGAITLDEYSKSTAKNSLEIKGLKTEQANLTGAIKSAEQAYKGAETSMVRMNAELGLMRSRYRELTDAERNSAAGKEMLTKIQTLDTEIKKLDASIGNHQRNVGNYPQLMNIVGQSMASNIPVVGNMAGAIAGATSSMAGMSTGFMAIGGAVMVAGMAFGAYLSAIKDGVQKLIHEEEQVSMLTFALDGNAKAAQKMIGFAKELANTSLFKKSDILDAENLALNLGRTEEQSKKLIETALGLSRATGIDLHAAVMQLSGTYEGVIGRLKRYDGALIDLSKTELAEGKGIDLLHEKFAKFGKEGLDTVAGSLQMAEKQMSSYHKQLASTWMPMVAKATDLWEKFWFWVAGGEKNKSGETFMSDYAKSQETLMRDADKKGQQIIIDRNEALKQSFFKLYKEQTDPAKQALFLKNFTDQAFVVDDLKKQMEELNKVSDTFSDKKGDNEAKQLREKQEKEYQDSLAKRGTAIEANNAYILSLTRKAIDDQISAMTDGAEKEKAISNDKAKDTRTDILNTQAEKVKAIDEEIKSITDKGKKATTAEKKQLEELKDQKLSIIEATDSAVVELEKKNKAELAAIDKKYSKDEADKKVTDKYSSDVQRVEEDGQMKLELLKTYYASKGTLTKDELQKEKQEEIKINLEVAQQKFNLLRAEIEARKVLGTETTAQLDADLARLAAIYKQVQDLTGQAGGASKKEEKNSFGGVGLGVNNLESEANQIRSATVQLINDLTNMWISAQQNRIALELKNETAKVDKMHNAAVKSLDDQKRKGIITEKQYNDRKEKLDEDAAKKKDELNKAAFEKDKKLKVAMAIIAGALAVVQFLANPGGVAGIVLAILAGLTAAAEIVTIENTKYTGAKGGLLRGPSHSQGGIKYAMGGDILELEGGEGVLNKRSMESNDVLTMSGTPRQIASNINTYKGWGVPFASGGYTPAPTPRRASPVNTESMSDMISSALSAQKVYVVESEISEVQGKAKQIKVESGW